MLKTIDLGWVAGILEGEGNFIFVNGPKIQLQMTDSDTIRKYKDIVGGERLALEFQGEGKEITTHLHFTWTNSYSVDDDRLFLNVIKKKRTD